MLTLRPLSQYHPLIILLFLILSVLALVVCCHQN
jgi:hypothetical protein